MRQARLEMTQRQSGQRQDARPVRRYVLNLCTSDSRQALMPATPQTLLDVGTDLSRFTFFTSRRVENGRELFCLHMGYFDTQEEAEQWVLAVREVYPAVWAGLEGQEKPPSDGGSTWVDMTGKYEVPQRLRSPAPRPRVVAPPPRERRPAARPAAVARPSFEPAPAPAPQGRDPEWDEGRDQRRNQEREAPPAYAAPARRPRPPAPPRPRPQRADARAARPLRTGGAERTAAAPARPVRPAPRRPLAAAARAGTSPGRPRKGRVFYVVELDCSSLPLSIEDAPALPELDLHTLYTVEGVTAGQRWHALRAGFFDDLAGARRLVENIQLELPTAKVVPVSVYEKRAATEATDGPPAYAQDAGQSSAASWEPAQTWEEEEEEEEQEPAGTWDAAEEEMPEEIEAYGEAESDEIEAAPFPRPSGFARFIGRIPLLGRLAGRGRPASRARH